MTPYLFLQRLCWTGKGQPGTCGREIWGPERLCCPITNSHATVAGPPAVLSLTPKSLGCGGPSRGLSGLKWHVFLSGLEETETGLGTEKGKEVTCPGLERQCLSQTTRWSAFLI